MTADCFTDQWVAVESCQHGCDPATASCKPAPAAPACTPGSALFGNLPGVSEKCDSGEVQATCSAAGQWNFVACLEPLAACVPATDCSALPCGSYDSCGTFCGSCPVPPVVPPVTPPVVSPPAVAAPKPLADVLVKFPFQPLFLRSVSFPDSDCVRPGETAVLAVKTQNQGRAALKDVSFAVLVPELGIRSSSGPFRLASGDKTTRLLRIDVPEDAVEDVHMLRLSITSNKLKRSVHRPFVVSGSC